MKKEIKERLKEQIKKLSREELEKKYLELLIKSVADKKTARLSGTLGAIISQNKQKQKKDDYKEQYKLQLEHPLWLKKRQIILDRDNHKCMLCGSSENLQVHHTKYSKGKKAWEYPNSTLVTLCRNCHQKVHDDKSHSLNPFKM